MLVKPSRTGYPIPEIPVAQALVLPDNLLQRTGTYDASILAGFATLEWLPE
jgi:hypothetical protein